MLADRREIVSRRIEYILPSGTNGAEVDRTLNVAANEYREMNGLETDCYSYVRVEARDDAVVVSFVVEKAAS